MSDRMALSIWREIGAQGLPAPCALIGFDDIPEAATAGLSTIRQNSFLKGEQAVRIALDGLDSTSLPVELLIRST
jgi:DNA-binding LacI/PurR family transcriptional regulator